MSSNLSFNSLNSQLNQFDKQTGIFNNNFNNNLGISDFNNNGFNNF